MSVSPASLRLFLDDAHALQDIPHEHIEGNTKKYATQNKNRQPIIFIQIPVINPTDSCSSFLYLIIYSTTGFQDSQIGTISFHIGHDASPGNVITVHIGQLSLKSHTWSDKILMVFHSYYHNKTSTGRLVAYTIFISKILCHAKGILIIYLSYDDK